MQFGDVAASPENGLAEESVILSHQIRALDKRRIRRVIGRLSKTDLDKLKQELRTILSL